MPRKASSRLLRTPNWRRGPGRLALSPRCVIEGTSCRIQDTVRLGHVSRTKTIPTAGTIGKKAEGKKESPDESIPVATIKSSRSRPPRHSGLPGRTQRQHAGKVHPRTDRPSARSFGGGDGHDERECDGEGGYVTIRTLLKERKYGPQANQKTKDGCSHRDALFHHINETVRSVLAERQPAISVDAKKKDGAAIFAAAYGSARSTFPPCHRYHTHSPAGPTLSPFASNETGPRTVSNEVA